MIVVMKSGTPALEIERLSQELHSWNLKPKKIVGKYKTIIGLVGDTAALNPRQIQQLNPFIEQVTRIDKPFKRASQEYRHGGEPSEVFVSTPLHLSKDKTMKSNLQVPINYTKAPDLSSFQRILLKANGTVTAMLEAYFSEPIQVVKLSENLVKMELELPNIKLNQEEQVIARKVLLQGKMSRRNFIYADSLILINNLDERFSSELLNTKIPIGKLWSEQKVETFKEIIETGIEPANKLSNYFCIEPEENILFRTYSVSSQGKITMIITEKFPEHYFAPQIPLAS